MIIPLMVLLMVLVTVAWTAYVLPLGMFAILMLSMSPLLITYMVFTGKMFRA